MSVKIAFAGNPNCGKTTLFNRYTGSKQYVGNWAGVTIEKKEAVLRYNGADITMIDLPGIYALSPYSMEEVITRDYIIFEKPDVIIDVVDGTNIERNLYLAVQLMELGTPMIVAVNMIDELESAGDSIDCSLLSALLGVGVIPVSAKQGRNTDILLERAVQEAASKRSRFPQAQTIRYDCATTRAIHDIYMILLERQDQSLPLLFFSGKLLEADERVPALLSLSESELERIEKAIAQYEGSSNYGDRETMLADARYRYVTELCRQTVKKHAPQGERTLSDRIDSIVTNRIAAIPIFLIAVFTMFAVTFGPVGEGLKNAVETLMDTTVTGGVHLLLQLLHAPEWTYSLLIGAVIGGVGNVLSFLPQIAILFLFLSLMEDSGYMARAAFIMDRLLSGIGLSGKSFIPMLMGFGCTTPAVMAARTMEHESDRRLTVMITPFMSCGARLPIYALFTAVFFPERGGLVVFSLYLLGLTVAIACGFVLKNTLFRGQSAPFIMELPPYRLPSLSSLLLHVWDKAKGFLTKAGTVIFSMSVLIWLLQNFDFQLRIVHNNADSIFAALGRLIAPLFAPLGFGDWQAAVSILAGFVAKEAVVSTIAVLYGASSTEALHAVLADTYTPLSAYAFMVFCLLYIPCISAFASIKREMGSMRWAVGTAALNTGVAYLVAFSIYRIGLLIVSG